MDKGIKFRSYYNFISPAMVRAKLLANEINFQDLEEVGIFHIFRPTKRGYGRWELCIEMVINGGHFRFTHQTTDSELIDGFETDSGKEAILDRVLSLEYDKINNVIYWE